MFKALDRPHYDTLQLNRSKSKKTQGPQARQVSTLADLAAVTLNWHSAKLEDGMQDIPRHLLPHILKLAILNDQAWAVITLIANWPFQTLRFSDILNTEEAEVFEDEMAGINYFVLDGLTGRTKACKLTCLDFTNIILHTSLVRQMIQAWPLLSLTKSKLKPKTLAKTVAKTAGLDQVKLSFEIIPKILAERLDNDVIRFATSRIKLPRGQRLEIKLDDVYFTTQSMFFLDYMIVNCLRDITPLHVTVGNIHIRSEIIDGDIITDSLAPFVVLKGQNAETLEGLSLQQLEEGILWLVIDDLCRFTRLTALDLQDCNIYLQEGKTRARTSTRARLSNTLKCLTSLRRLNLASNYLVGCLGEILDAVQNPLQFLGIRSCDLDQSDLSSLEQSKHAASIRELNISKLCHFSLFGSDNLTPSDVLKMVKHFPNVTVLNLAQNHLTDSGMGDFLQTLPKLTSLKGLDLSGNNLQLDSHLSLARACAHIPVMQWLRLSSVDRLNLDEFLENLNFGNQEMEGKIMNAMKELGREDISVNILPPSVAIMVDLVDFFD
ncbi:uncharacterized protein LOC128206691 [Mya arenaria]|uniref:uncharacterized protein LOC128206691 n=1 Tax=Mya arenaria TaxID=6604 RepID=UPI0022E989BA|nr:uncharacterized protein LOC128206691 [Mya arenaria]XP_052765265.1 uncharacterized protein LOC128206691 [Mya arenaria]